MAYTACTIFSPQFIIKTTDAEFSFMHKCSSKEYDNKQETIKCACFHFDY